MQTETILKGLANIFISFQERRGYTITEVWLSHKKRHVVLLNGLIDAISLVAH